MNAHRPPLSAPPRPAGLQSRPGEGGGLPAGFGKGPGGRWRSGGGVRARGGAPGAASDAAAFAKFRSRELGKRRR